jgi:hypothetical protein
VKKLDTIIHALEVAAPGRAAAAAPIAADSAEASKKLALSVGDAERERLESVRKTREVLITDPNSKAHLRIGKLKAVRRRVARVSAGAGGDSSDRDTTTDDGYARRRLSTGSGNSGGVDGLLEAAASLSDGETTPGTPRRGAKGEHTPRERSPRTSGRSTFGDDDIAEELGNAAAALGALTEAALGRASGGGGEAQTASKPAAAALIAKPAPAPALGGFDPTAFAAQLAAFTPPPAAAAAAQAARGAAPVPTMPNMMAACMNPSLMFAWMSGVANAAAAAQPAGVGVGVGPGQAAGAAAWNPNAFAQMLAQANAFTAQAQAQAQAAVQAAAGQQSAVAPPAAPPANIESAHQPL